MTPQFGNLSHSGVYILNNSETLVLTLSTTPGCGLSNIKVEYDSSICYMHSPMHNSSFTIKAYTDGVDISSSYSSCLEMSSSDIVLSASFSPLYRIYGTFGSRGGGYIYVYSMDNYELNDAVDDFNIFEIPDSEPQVYEIFIPAGYYDIQPHYKKTTGEFSTNHYYLYPLESFIIVNDNDINLDFITKKRDTSSSICQHTSSFNNKNVQSFSFLLFTGLIGICFYYRRSKA